MASTGFTACGTGANVDSGSTPWGTPDSITANDNVFATNDDGDTGPTDKLRCTMGANAFSVPAGSTIDGVEVRLTRLRDAGTAVLQQVHQLVNAGSGLGSAKTTESDIPTSETALTVGSSSDVWGATLTSTVVNSSTFGVDVHLTWDSLIPAGTNAKYDIVEVNVHYTAPVGGASDLLLRHVG